MKIPSTLKQFIKTHINGLRKCMRLTHFKVDAELVDLKDATMQIEVDYRYLDCQILIDRMRLLELWRTNKEEILACLAHELSHIVTMEMSDPFSYKGTNDVIMSKTKTHFEERVTEHFSRIALRLYILENKLMKGEL